MYSFFFNSFIEIKFIYHPFIHLKCTVQCASSVIAKKSLPNPMSWRFSSVFSFKIYLFSVLKFISGIHLEFTYVCGMWQGSIFILLHVAINLSQYHLLARLSFSPLNCLVTLVESQPITNVRIYFWILNSIPLIYIYP